MKQVFLGFGSNIGNRREYIEKALNVLGQYAEMKLIKRSAFYETEPVGKKEQPFFLNLVAEFETSFTPDELLTVIKKEETNLGRKQRGHWDAREIDIDILFFGDECIENGTLIVPHKEISRRRFVLSPMAEIAPEFIDPRSGTTIANLLEECVDQSFIERIA
jgi:2-amino-4-hydroxy-6-hydroxymethyldihydropteridine diphosphokinase